MGFLKKLFKIVVVLVLALAAYVRLAPSDVARWHVAPNVDQDEILKGGAKRRLTTGPDGLQRLHEIALKTPGTTVLAGDPDQGMVTYITRSRTVGFPDYTTVQQQGDDLLIYARLRFGSSDLGVNAARLDVWGRALTP